MLFEKYAKPETLEECSSLLNEFGNDAKILAGGTDIIPKLRGGTMKLKMLVDISGIVGFNSGREEADGFHMGAMMRLRDLQDMKSTLGVYSVVSECASHVSSIQIRNIATIGGNSCNASPSADTVPGLVCMKAICEIASSAGKRSISIDDFETGPGRNVLEEGEVLTGFFIPKPPKNTGAAYSKYAIRGDSDISIIGSGVRLTLDDDSTILDAVIVLAAVAPKHIRVPRAEKLLVGQKPSDALFEEAARIAMCDCSPITDQRATAEYRKKMVRTFTMESLKKALAKI